jgi:plasmid stabilization system protein ParE
VTYQVELTESAQREINAAYQWLLARTPQHAPLWLEGLAESWQSLSEMPNRCPRAPEADEIKADVRQLLYGKKKGVYRILFIVRDQTVYVLHVRHGAREPLRKGEFEFPPDRS